MRYGSALASPNFLFPTGTLWELGDFLGGPSCGLRMLFYWICPLVTPTPCQHWGIFWEGHHATLGCCSIAMPSSHSHSHITSAWFASSPLHRHSLTHSTPPGLAVLRSHQALEASTHYFGLVCFFLLRVSALHYLAGDRVLEGFWTVASARALHQPTSCRYEYFYNQCP